MSQPESEHAERKVAELDEEHRQDVMRILGVLADRAGASAVRSATNGGAYAAVIASLIGLLALVVSAYTAYVQREQLRAQAEQLRAQVWPHLYVDTANVSPYVGFHVVNVGMGPASVRKVRVTVDKKAVTSWSGAQQAMGEKPGGVIQSQISGTVLPPGKDLTLARPYDDATTPRFIESFLGDKHAIVVTVCYCSVLETCWVASSATEGSIDPEPCPIYDWERFKD